jgi:uncharacterized protein
MNHHTSRALYLAAAALLLSGCLLRAPVTRTFGFMPKQLTLASAHPAYWGFMDGALDTITTRESGVQLSAWWIPSSRIPSRCGSALLLHGKGKTRAEMVSLARTLSASGFDVLVPDYRGYGGSTGSPSKAGVLADAQAAYAHLQQRAASPQSPVLIVGHSMGTALAAKLARDHSAAAVVYLSPFFDLSRLARARFGWFGTQLLDTAQFDFRPADDARHVMSKSLVGIAGRDLLIPRRVAEEFIAVITPPPFVITDERATHNSILESERVIRAVADSTRAWMRCPA